jgi:hypothetical protein
MSYDTLVKALREVVKKELEISLDVGNVSSATSTTLVDSSKNWATNQWANCFVEIPHIRFSFLHRGILCSQGQSGSGK